MTSNFLRVVAAGITLAFSICSNPVSAAFIPVQISEEITINWTASCVDCALTEAGDYSELPSDWVDVYGTISYIQSGSESYPWLEITNASYSGSNHVTAFSTLDDDTRLSMSGGTVDGASFDFFLNIYTDFVDWDDYSDSLSLKISSDGNAFMYLPENENFEQTDLRFAIINNNDDSAVADYGFTSRILSNDVPEPSTLAIFALGLMGLGLRRFKKQS